MSDWSPSSWRQRPASQQPTYPDPEQLNRAIGEIYLGALTKGKADLSDIRESPALKIIAKLRAQGAEVSYHDPHVPELDDLGLRSADLAAEEVDVACIVTAHPEVDYGAVVERAPLVVDFRGVTRFIDADNVVLIGRGPGVGQRRAIASGL